MVNHFQTFSAFADFLKSRFDFLQVALTPGQQKELYSVAKSACDIVECNIKTGELKSSFMAVGTINRNSISFLFCDNSSFIVDLGKMNVNGATLWSSKIKDRLNALPFPKITYDETKKMELPRVPFVIAPSDLETYLATKKYFYEGEFEQTEPDEYGDKYKFGIMNSGDTIKVVYLAGAANSGDWKAGELKGFLLPTNSKKVFKSSMYYSNKSMYENVGSLIFDDENLFTIAINNFHQKFVRVK